MDLNKVRTSVTNDEQIGTNFETVWGSSRASFKELRGHPGPRGRHTKVSEPAVKASLRKARGAGKHPCLVCSAHSMPQPSMSAFSLRLAICAIFPPSPPASHTFARGTCDPLERKA